MSTYFFVPFLSRIRTCSYTKNYSIIISPLNLMYYCNIVLIQRVTSILHLIPNLNRLCGQLIDIITARARAYKSTDKSLLQSQESNLRRCTLRTSYPGLWLPSPARTYGHLHKKTSNTLSWKSCERSQRVPGIEQQNMNCEHFHCELAYILGICHLVLWHSSWIVA